jgi:uncharacterized Zn-binding protein involved in type VI secretion
MEPGRRRTPPPRARGGAGRRRSLGWGEGMDSTTLAGAAAAATAAYTLYGCCIPRPRRSLLLGNGGHTFLKIDLSGGSLAAFFIADSSGSDGVNPLSWDCATHDGLDPADVAPRPLGHFLCCDRWGPPTPAELDNGMYYHGEAPQVEWQVEAAAGPSAVMTAALPMAKMTIRRSVQLAPIPQGRGRTAIAKVEETVTNVGTLGRLFNMVQHPSLGAPFLSASTVVHCNGKRGFAQGDNTNTCAAVPEETTFKFPVSPTIRVGREQSFGNGQTLGVAFAGNDQQGRPPSGCSADDRRRRRRPEL